MDWSENVLCIKCNEGGNLLVCNENGCPIAVHEDCMNCPARFDGEGRYCCPYCFYKQIVAETHKAREYALAKKKALLHFMDEKIMGGEKCVEENVRAENNGPSEPKSGEENERSVPCNNSKSKVNHDANLDKSIQSDEEPKVDSAEDEEVQKEESEGSSGPKLPNKLHEEQSISFNVDKNNQEEKQTRNQEEEQSIDSRGKKNREEEHETSAASSSQNPSDNIEEEKIQETKCGSSSFTDEDPVLPVRARATRQSKRKKPVEQDSDTDSERTSPIMTKRVSPTMKKKPSPTNSPRKSSGRPSASETKKGSNRVVGSPKRSKQPEKSLVKLANDVFGGEKRKRRLWTRDEEEALKAGVENFSKVARVNMPWRKILDFGRGVFDETRNPSDLKDKWRSMAK